jgi:hypothetical protein
VIHGNEVTPSRPHLSFVFFRRRRTHLLLFVALDFALFSPDFQNSPSFDSSVRLYVYPQIVVLSTPPPILLAGIYTRHNKSNCAGTCVLGVRWRAYIFGCCKDIGALRFVVGPKPRSTTPRLPARLNFLVSVLYNGDYQPNTKRFTFLLQ